MTSQPSPDSFSIAEVSALSDLACRVYANPIAVETWSEIIQLLRPLINFKSVGVVRISPEMPVEWIPIIPDPEGADRHAEHEDAVVEIVNRALELGLAVWRPEEAIGEREWQESRVRAYMKSRGAGDMVCVLCRIGPEEATNICFTREDIDSRFSDRDIFMLRHLQHHISTASRILKAAAVEEAAAETFRQIMRPGFICNRNGEILEMNKFGRRFVEEGDADPQALQSLIETTARELMESDRNWTHVDFFGDKGRLSVHPLVLRSKPPRYAIVIDSYDYFRRVLRHRMQDHGLTPREIEICALLMQARSNRQIAETLFIAESTVKDHMTNILGKFGVTSRSGIISKLLGYDTD